MNNSDHHNYYEPNNPRFFVVMCVLLAILGDCLRDADPVALKWGSIVATVELIGSNANSNCVQYGT